jgi:PAS domain S-box-containing protein
MDKQQYIRNALERLFAKWMRRACAFGAFIFLLLSFLDFVVFREHFALFLFYRVSAAALLLSIAVLAGKTTDRTKLRAVAYASVCVSAITIEAMILHTGGHQSPYATGMILLAVTALAFVPADFFLHATLAACIYGIYLIPILMTDRVDDIRSFFMTNFFMCSIIFVVLAFRYLSMQTVIRQLETEYELTASGNRLRESEARLRYLLAESQAVIYTCEVTGDYPVTFISENVRGQLGYEPQDFLDSPRFRASRVHPEDAPLISAGLPRLFERGHQTLEYRVRHKDGAYRWLHDDMRLFRDQSGEPVEIVGSLIDISARRQTEDMLRLSEEYFRSIAEVSEIVIYRLSELG